MKIVKDQVRNQAYNQAYNQVRNSVFYKVYLHVRYHDHVCFRIQNHVRNPDWFMAKYRFGLNEIS